MFLFNFYQQIKCNVTDVIWALVGFSKTERAWSIKLIFWKSSFLANLIKLPSLGKIEGGQLSMMGYFDPFSQKVTLNIFGCSLEKLVLVGICQNVGLVKKILLK